jgi:hypothetical protein
MRGAIHRTAARGLARAGLCPAPRCCHVARPCARQLGHGPTTLRGLSRVAVGHLSDIPTASTPLPPHTAEEAQGEDGPAFVAPPLSQWGSNELLMTG